MSRPPEGSLGTVSPDEMKYHRDLERQRIEQDAASLAADLRVARIIGRIHLLRQLLGQPEPPKEELNCLREATLAQMEESLKRQLSGKKNGNGTSPPAQA
jgi:hypothetical protein